MAARATAAPVKGGARRSTRAARAGLGIAVALLAPRAAFAQNAEGFFYSEDAALMAGAVTARPGDTASLWYNPAGLAAIERARVSANGSVLGLRIRNVPDAFVTRVGGADVSLDLDSTDVIAVPNALTASFHVAPGVTVGAGLFATVRDVRKAANDAIERDVPDLEGATLSERIDIQSDATKYHLGPGVGFQLGEGLRLGLATFATYRTDAAVVQYALGFASSAGNVHEIGQASISQSLFGFTGAVGFQADLGRFVHLGITARPPELFVHGSSQGGGVAAGAVDETSSLEVVRATAPDSGTSMLAPARLAVGVVVTPRPTIELGFDAEIQTGMDNPALGLASHPTVNGRAGARFAVSDAFVIGGGLFTDFSPVDELGLELVSEDVDWFGGTLGASLRTPLALARDPEKKDALVLSTTLAVRYALGTGVARALVVDTETSYPSRDVVFHDVMPFFGSSVLF